ncbi:MAG: phosphoribosylamine--glycine ligase [Gammaproteobacteria bacterium]|nr:phosphoribosylamine--glycine ligase [Gammaproteobacteria bacterium]MDE2348957.1 phosphoribosylamine--glycine ligase [Gammaproteobacteria bacterium]
MKVLIVGGGGREHALAWKCAQSERVRQVFVAPGNAGTALEPKTQNVDIAATDIEALAAFAAGEGIDLAIIGPEAPLVAGIADRFAAAGLACFGPSRDAARLEGSKAYTKDFLVRHGIPTAAYRNFTRADFDPAYVRACRLPVVVKADGLAAGKGVVICDTHDEALAAATRMLDGAYGAAGDTIVIEEFLRGEEVSFIVVAADQEALPLATSQDHKRRDDGDLGPNTGGMGAYSPAPIVTDALHARIMREVIEPTLRGLRTDGNPYTGFLYAGLMIAADGTPNVLEFNCRLGDPETQPIMMRLQSDLAGLCEAALAGELHRTRADWDPRAALGVVLAAGGYPDTAAAGDPIRGLDRAARLPGKVFHGGTRLRDNEVVTNGGRVLCAVGMGSTVRAARREAYALVDAIHWDSMRYRRDIGARALAREGPEIPPSG